MLKAEDVIAYQRTHGYLPKDLPPLDGAIICLKRGLPERLRRKHPYRKAGHYIGDLLLLKKSPKKIAVMTNFGFGAPLMASLTEELIGLGATRLISVGLAGAIQPDLRSGEIVLCDRAIRDEGTSHHYLPSEKLINANPGLVEELANTLEVSGRTIVKGATWSIDAPFRETHEEVTYYQREGVKTVEMESAALFAVAQVYGVQAASVLVIGDTLAEAQWRAPQDLRLLDRSFEFVYDAAVNVLNNL